MASIIRWKTRSSDGFVFASRSSSTDSLEFEDSIANCVCPTLRSFFAAIANKDDVVKVKIEKVLSLYFSSFRMN